MKRSDFLKRAAIIGGSVVLFKELPPADEAAFSAVETLTPVAQGSTITSLQGLGLEGHQIIAFGFDQAASLPWHLEQFEPKFLRRSLPMKPATSTEVKWGLSGKNVTQIFRTPFSATGSHLAVMEDGTWAQITRRALMSHLQSVEHALEHGRLKRWAAARGEHMGIYRIGQMAGAIQLLGRPPLKSDTFTLRVLRDLSLCQYVNVADIRVGEWLSEITLEAHR